MDEAQLVADLRHRKIVFGAAHAAALERDDFQARLGQLFREYAAGPAQADDDDIDSAIFLLSVAMRIWAAPLL